MSSSSQQPPEPQAPHARTLLSRAHSPATASTIHTEKILKRPLYLTPTPHTPSARSRRRTALNHRREAASKRAQQCKPRPLSARKKRALGLLDVPKEEVKDWAVFERLNGLWAAYMREVLGVDGDGGGGKCVTPAGAGVVLASADMHGAYIKVVRSRCVSRVGIEGVVVRDSKFGFWVVGRGEGVKMIPKEHTVFRFEVPLLPARSSDTEGNEQVPASPEPLVFEIMGEQFQSRAPDRANKKFRMHFQPDI